MSVVVNYFLDSTTAVGSVGTRSTLDDTTRETPLSPSPSSCSVADVACEIMHHRGRVSARMGVGPRAERGALT